MFDATYSALVLINVLYLTLMISAARTNSIMPRRPKNGFTVAFSLLITVSLAEWAGVLLDGGDPSLIWAHRLAKLVEFSIAPSITVVLTASIRPNRKFLPPLILLAIYLVIQLVSLFTGWIFVVDTANVYHRCGGYWIYISAYLVSILWFLYNLWQMEREYQRRNIRQVLLICVFLIMTSGIQIIRSSIRVAWLTTGMTAAMIYLAYSDLLQQVDAVTILLNRSCYRSAIDDLHGQKYIFLFDVNSFKQINDRYGHPYGDVCLRTLADLLRRTFTPYGQVYRIGGDEFCSIVSDACVPEKILAGLQASVREAQARDDKLPDLSFGWAFYDHGHDNVLDIIDLADSRLYEMKRSLHARA